MASALGDLSGGDGADNDCKIINMNDETGHLLIGDRAADIGIGDTTMFPNIPDFSAMEDSELPGTFDRFKTSLDSVIDLLDRFRARANDDAMICPMIDELTKRQEEFEDQKRFYLGELDDMTDEEKIELKVKVGTCAFEIDDVRKSLIEFEQGRVMTQEGSDFAELGDDEESELTQPDEDEDHGEYQDVEE